MSITKEEIKKLADLSRIEMTEEETDKMAGEIDSILGYVGMVQKSSGSEERQIPKHRNVMRQDITTNKPNEYKEKILNNSPEKDKDYIIVKKIL